MDAEVFRVHADVEQRHWWFAARRAILHHLVRALIPPGRTVVDVGCGVGANAPAFTGEYAYVGFDPSSSAIEHARRSYPGGTFRHGTAAQSSVELGEADAVLLTDVLEHVADDRALLGEVVSSMKPGAVLIVTVPAGMHLWSPHDAALGHYRRYDRDMLAACWADLPVLPEMMSHFNSRLYAPVRVVRMLTVRAGTAAGGVGTDLLLPPAPLNALLTRLFAGEADRLLAALQQRRPGYRRGVSLIAVLRRTEATRA